jgi:hypothetical protein
MVAIWTSGQQKASEEFVSVIGQFGVMLPTNIRDDFRRDIIRMDNDKLISWIYRWNLASDQAVVLYAIGNIDFEAKADFYLEKFRDTYAPGSVMNQKKTSFAGHPGLVSVIESPRRGREISRSMIWTYLLKNRVYLMSLTLDDEAKTEEHLKLMSTFRLLSPKDIEPRVTAMVEELTPERLPQIPAPSRPTTDARDAALKGRVKSVTTESEPYVDESLYGARELVSVENYDEQGNIVNTVVYRNSRPASVRLYGIHEGDRAFRETIRVWKSPTYSKDKDDFVAKEPKFEQGLYTIKYKYDSAGNLLEMRVLRDDGKEMESARYKLKSNTVAHRYDSDYQPVRSHLVARSLLEMIMIANTPGKLTEIVSKLDANGNSIEDAHQIPNGRYSRPRSDGFHTTEEYFLSYRTDKERHEYKFDDHGNWIQRKTFALTKDKGTGATEITYRTITYYQ